MLFSELQLIQPILKALEEEGYTNPTPIQEKSIPVILGGFDLLGCAQTGTGKTAAFALPIIQKLSASRSSEENIPHSPTIDSKGGKKAFTPKRRIRSLILTPTRELAIQIHESFRTYGKYAKLRSMVIFGWVGQSGQVASLREGVDIVIATPGRLLDLMSQNHVSLQGIEIFVLDEADRMLDMGFIHDIKKVIALLPSKKQTLFFSATMPPEIVKLSHTLLHNPAKVTVTPVSSTVEIIKQCVYFVDKKNKMPLLLDILKEKSIKTALVFTRTKSGANKVVKILLENNITAEAIHGNKAQSARQRALTNFKSQTTRVLVATDIAARGIDIDELEYVINYEIPNISETYVHRIWRTGRAWARWTAISLCDAEEKIYLADIEKLIAKKIPVIENHGFPLLDHNPPPTPKPGMQRHLSSRPRGFSWEKKEKFAWKKREEPPKIERPKTERIVKEKQSWSTDSANLGPGHRRDTPRFPKPHEKYPKKSWEWWGKKEGDEKKKEWKKDGEKPKFSYKKEEKWEKREPKKWYPKPRNK